jgi:hypothetical protein
MKNILKLLHIDILKESLPIRENKNSIILKPISLLFQMVNSLNSFKINKHLIEAMVYNFYAQGQNKDTPLHHFSPTKVGGNTAMKRKVWQQLRVDGLG